jgi:hypothetical protein
VHAVPNLQTQGKLDLGGHHDWPVMLVFCPELAFCGGVSTTMARTYGRTSAQSTNLLVAVVVGLASELWPIQGDYWPHWSFGKRYIPPPRWPTSC